MVLPTYDTETGGWNPAINMFSIEENSIVPVIEPYKTYNNYIVNSISISSNSKYIGVGYVNSNPGSLVSGLDSLSFIDLLAFSNSKLKLLQRFNYNSQLGNKSLDIVNYVQLSKDGSLLMINNGANQRLVYDISELTGVEINNPVIDEIINVNLFPNPTAGEVKFGNLNFDEVLVFNSIGQLVLKENFVNKVDLYRLPSGFYNFLFFVDGEIKYSSKVIKQ